MLARLRKAQADDEGGFTLIELLVVMIIIGILAAIAIPAFLSQRAKARDTSTKADVSTVGKELATYYVDGANGAPGLTVTGGNAVLTVATVTVATVKVSNGTIASSAPASGATSLDWCVSLSNADGSLKDYKYSAAGGLAPGTC